MGPSQLGIAGIAQLVERELPKLEVAGSNPVARSIPSMPSPRTSTARPQAAGAATVVAVIGRPNVGKSTFFTRVLGERRAVVDNRPGITRDRNTARTDWAGRSLVLVDTGGFLPTAAEGREAAVRRQAEVAIELADAVLFLVDATTGVTDLDSAIARNLRRRDTPCLLVVNKVDRPGDPVTHEFHRLGLGEPQPISSEVGLGIGDLLDRLIAVLPEPREAEADERPRVAIVGRPNVGKSSIVNALLGEERVLVEPEPGTTLDAIDAAWSTPAGELVLVDTAGIRHRARFDDQAEFFATLRALHALEKADVVCLVVDATQGFQRQEARLTQQVLEAGRSIVLLYNKWDVVEEREQRWKALMADRARRYPTLADLPALPVSALRGTNLHRLPALVFGQHQQACRKLTTATLNKWLAEVQRKRQIPSGPSGRRPRIYYATQTGVRPPELTLFVNDPIRLGVSYRRFLLSDFIDRFGFRGIPVRMRFRRSK